jgi:serine/threonine protein kinase
VIARTQVKVHQHKVIMNGDSAVICKAQFLSLSCAAKYIHPELSKCSKWQVEDFERGCKLLQNIRHPNIVLPFGICYDESVVGPILIMELMDLNLKDFLEKSHQSPLPLHSQLGLCSDVAQGLEFLHSNNIIHSNLTATNILVKGGRAKIGGVTSLQVNAPEAELSVGSGAAVGLPRKSFSSGIYDEDVDCFSFGVLALHVITREMPQPLTKILEPEDATISEVTRYKISLEKVDDNHPMRQLIVDCLNDVSFQRPSAGELCKRLSEMSKSAGYRDSQMADLLSTKLVNLQIKFTQNAIHKKEQEQRKLLEQLDEEKREAETKMEVDRENMQNTIAMLTLHNKDLERKIAAASKELDDKKTEVKKISAEETEKSATMLAKIKELETEKAYYKKKAEESDSGFAQYLSQQN